MINRPLTPLQAMTLTSAEKPEDLLTDSSEQIRSVDPHIVTNWEYSDRPEPEIGDIQSLAKEFQELGQLQPCIVREAKNLLPFQYELIAGERRWRAALIAKTRLKVVVKDLLDAEAALLQISENESRKDLSDYAKSLNYCKLINNGVLLQKDLIHKLNKSKQYISSMLSFSKIPQEIIDSIGDMSKVSYRTAEEICRLSKKGKEYIQALLKVADKISTGSFGQERINRFVTKEINASAVIRQDKEKYYGRNGKLLLSIKTSSEGLYSFHLSRNMSLKMTPFKREFTEEITNVIEKLLTKSAAAD